MLRDLAERYAQNGIVTSAAELFEEIELWDEVVDCYRQAGKDGKAEQIVRTRLRDNETPRMWTALGDITKDPSYYHRAIELSRGRFSGAYAALGKYHFDKGELKEASLYFEHALRIKPHSPHMWFRLGTIAMRLQDWTLALQAFTEVVQQEPEEGDAWANVAAVHMYNKRPEEAYPALIEVS
jgi:tetratricopeptide (TPR) repeat protein